MDKKFEILFYLLVALGWGIFKVLKNKNSNQNKKTVSESPYNATTNEEKPLPTHEKKKSFSEELSEMLENVFEDKNQKYEGIPIEIIDETDNKNLKIDNNKYPYSVEYDNKEQHIKNIKTDDLLLEENVDEDERFDFKKAIIYSEILKRPEY